ncbi:MAG: ParB/RepB/Spo0J family partition protein [Gammaproteobacteria bacterium]|nr:ParB/RepB/Spo0J family partition protein [Gammaproteobacteria bacterium]
MSNKKRGLGRGLDALLGGMADDLNAAPVSTSQPETQPAPAAASGPKDGELRHLPVDVLQRGRYQPRIDMDPAALEELAESIRAQGVVQPIVVRALDGQSGRYEIVAGERRWRAAQQAGLHEIPAVIRQIPDNVALAIALIENIQREQLNPVEEAIALQRLIEEFELTHQEAAEAVGRSRVSVSNLLRLLTLNDDVKRMLESGDLEMGHARALLGLTDIKQSEAARIVVNRGLSVRETEHLVRQMLEAPKVGGSSSKPVDPNVRKLQDDLSEKLGARVALQHNAKGKGKLVISYNNLDELDGILEHIK